MLWIKIFIAMHTVISITMKTLDDIPVGESWATKFKVTTFLQDGVPVRPKALNVGEVHPGKPGVYEGLGIIKKRDRDKQRLEVIDVETRLNFYVPYADCWDWDTIEWCDNDGIEQR